VLPQARQGLAEQHKLVAEKNALIETVKRLNREVAKLEHFKRNLLQQLQDDDEVGHGAAAVQSFSNQIGLLSVLTLPCHSQVQLQHVALGTGLPPHQDPVVPCVLLLNETIGRLMACLPL
jgi:hypothetical protein